MLKRLIACLGFAPRHYTMRAGDSWALPETVSEPEARRLILDHLKVSGGTTTTTTTIIGKSARWDALYRPVAVQTLRFSS